MATQRDSFDTGNGAEEPRPRVLLRSSAFRQVREDDWRALEILVEKTEKRGIRALSAEELQRLPLLYRSTVSSLSVARSIALDRNLLAYLENLSLRAFLIVYGPRSTLWKGISGFFARDFPAAVRGAWPHLMIVFLAMMAGGLAGFLLTAADEQWYSSLVPSGLADDRGPHSTREDLLDREIFGPWEGAAHAFALFANTLFQHNTMVGILAFSLGLAAGIPTILLMLYNGLILGAFIGLHYNRGLTLHGPIAGRIALGAVLLFFVAAILEGGFRQLVAHTELRYAIGWGFGLVWLVYFMRAGKR
jgi:uncharacterized membrane protein SpoIIM required for sporulation